MHQRNFITAQQRRGSEPPVVAELRAVFDALPDSDLISMLTGPKRRGRPGYQPRVMWRAFVAYYMLGLPSISDLVRLLHDNPYVAAVCGMERPEDIPSQPTFSRFVARLARPKAGTEVRNVMRNLSLQLHKSLPDFGKSVAIDSTDVKGWSNGGKRYRGKSSDTDAGWCVKTNTEGNKKYVWGYKVHILADAKYELPIAAIVTAGNVHDVKKATPLLMQARVSIPFNPEYVIADKGYSSIGLIRSIRRQYRAKPIIDAQHNHRLASEVKAKTPEWKAIYATRGSIERVNSRLKAHRKLNSVRVRGRFKVRVHAYMSMIVMQAQALATGTRQSVRKAA